MYRNLIFTAVTVAAAGCGVGGAGSDFNAGSDDAPLLGTDGGSGGSGGAPACAAGKVLLCHFPPGNPGNLHTLCVGASAVDAHVQHHGDSLGACGPSIGTPPQEPPDAGASWTPVPVPVPAVMCLSAGGACGADADCCEPLVCAAGQCTPLVP